MSIYESIYKDVNNPWIIVLCYGGDKYVLIGCNREPPRSPIVKNTLNIGGFIFAPIRENFHESQLHFNRNCTSVKIGDMEKWGREFFAQKGGPEKSLHSVELIPSIDLSPKSEEKK